MTITFNNALATLKSMFPDMEEALLKDIIISENYHIERTVEAVLKLTSHDTQQSGSVRSSIATSAPKSAPEPVTRPKYRGKNIKLSNDFLQLPGQKISTIVQDEELAMMLMMQERQEAAKRKNDAKTKSVFESARKSVNALASKFSTSGNGKEKKQKQQLPAYTAMDRNAREGASTSLLHSHSDEELGAENPLLVHSKA